MPLASNSEHLNFRALYWGNRSSFISRGCKVQSPLVIVDLSVILKMSTITRESTILREIPAKMDNQSTKSIHYNERFHYYEIHYYQRRLYDPSDGVSQNFLYLFLRNIVFIIFAWTPLSLRLLESELSSVSPPCLLHFLGELLVYASGMYKYCFSSGHGTIVYLTGILLRSSYAC